MAVDLSNPTHTWDTSLYAITQQYYGETDRQSVGVETRYLKTGRTVVALLDYDVHFSEINNAMFLGTLAMPWMLPWVAATASRVTGRAIAIPRLPARAVWAAAAGSADVRIDGAFTSFGPQPPDAHSFGSLQP